jgi:hypothetical protein
MISYDLGQLIPACLDRFEAPAFSLLPVLPAPLLFPLLLLDLGLALTLLETLDDVCCFGFNLFNQASKLSREVAGF